MNRPMTSEQRSNNVSGHHKGLDGIRGIAILGVMAVHFVRTPIPQNTFEKIITKAAGWGGLGVELFFVLSGFLITGILIDSKRDAHFFRNFYARRTLRIFPLYFGILAVLLLLLPQITSHLGILEPARENQIWLWTYTANYYIASEGSWALGPLSHFWTLAIEEHFYLFWPFVVFFLSRTTLERMSVLVVVTALSIRLYLEWLAPDSLINVITPCKIDAMCVGALFASRIRFPKTSVFRVSKISSLVLIVMIVALSVAGDFYENIDNYLQEIRETVIMFLFAILIIWGIDTPWRPRYFGILADNRLLRFFGKYSYGVYVYHGIITWYLDESVTLMFASILGSHTLGLLAKILFATVVSVLISWLSFEFFEKKFLKLKRYF